MDILSNLTAQGRQKSQITLRILIVLAGVEMWTPMFNGAVSSKPSLGTLACSLAVKLTAFVVGDVLRSVSEPCFYVSFVGRFDGKTDSFVELKTSMTIRGPHDEARFERYVCVSLSSAEEHQLLWVLYLEYEFISSSSLQKAAQILHPVILAWSSCESCISYLIHRWNSFSTGLQ
jgi:hypothetical protein